MSVIGTLLIGLVVGIVAKLLMPGIILTMLLGIAGAFIAHYIGQAAGWYTQNEPAGFIASVVGAIVLLLLYRLVFRPGRRV